MKVQIDGTNLVNKGAELMLYAILEEIERRFPNAIVIFNTPGASISRIRTNLFIRQPFYLRFGRKIGFFLKRICLFFNFGFDIDILLDARGFEFSDQRFIPRREMSFLNNAYARYKRNGAKIIFLPQAFGPFNTPRGQRYQELLSYSDLIFAREGVSESFLNTNGISFANLKIVTDFTIGVEAEILPSFDRLRNRVCFIPNSKMISHTSLTEETYVDFLVQSIKYIEDLGHQVFLLNHEGELDYKLCKVVNMEFDNRLPLLTNLTAKQTKGAISVALLCVSSRYHGVASALNQGVPCLATSWSHKYEMLFKDFNQHDCVIDLQEFDFEIYRKFLNPDFNNKVREILRAIKPLVLLSVKDMWESVWSQLDE